MAYHDGLIGPSIHEISSSLGDTTDWPEATATTAQEVDCLCSTTICLEDGSKRQPDSMQDPKDIYIQANKRLFF